MHKRIDGIDKLSNANSQPDTITKISVEQHLWPTRDGFVLLSPDEYRTALKQCKPAQHQKVYEWL